MRRPCPKSLQPLANFWGTTASTLGRSWARAITVSRRSCLSYRKSAGTSLVIARVRYNSQHHQSRMVSWLSRLAKYLAENRKLIVACGNDEEKVEMHTFRLFETRRDHKEARQSRLEVVDEIQLRVISFQELGYSIFPWRH
jgi:hypothetical protein